MNKLHAIHFDYGTPLGLSCFIRGLTRYSCLTKSAPAIKQLFSYFRLFTLSAYSEPQFWARTLLTFLLCWSGYASQELGDTILQSSEGKGNADISRVFCLPSRGTDSRYPLVQSPEAKTMRQWRQYHRAGISVMFGPSMFPISA